jgi:NAD(P)-dependent dehydrogenase (short-subunit alcohol dehydrogenase family)
MQLFDLTGKVAIVTGGNGGIGLGMAQGMASCGAAIVISGRNAGKAETALASLRALGVKADFIAADVTKKAECTKLIGNAVARFGRLDILVNNAGVIEPIASVAEGDPAAWSRSIQVNLTGAYYAIRAVLPGMVAAGGGTIVNVSSGAALRPLEGWSAYCAGKAGLAMLTRSIALEHAGQGVRVFGFQPGTTDTDMQVIIRASGVNQVSRIPRENLTPVAHPARAIVYLCTPAADDLSGQEFSLNNEAFRGRLNLK